MSSIKPAFGVCIFFGRPGDQHFAFVFRAPRYVAIRDIYIDFYSGLVGAHGFAPYAAFMAVQSLMALARSSSINFARSAMLTSHVLFCPGARYTGNGSCCFNAFLFAMFSFMPRYCSQISLSGMSVFSCTASSANLVFMGYLGWLCGLRFCALLWLALRVGRPRGRC